jgi:hypothetical protein
LIFKIEKGRLLPELDRIPKEAAADSRPDNWTGSHLFKINIWLPVWGYGRTFSVNSLWSKLCSCAKRECGNPWHKMLRLFGAATVQAQGNLGKDNHCSTLNF